jgi:hypothetical protein
MLKCSVATGSHYNHFLPLLNAQSVEVVLVSPRNPLNIGAVARAMANFGFEHLTVVAPYDRTGARLARRSARRICCKTQKSPRRWRRLWRAARW